MKWIVSLFSFAVFAQLTIAQDQPIAWWPFDDISGDTTEDRSTAGESHPATLFGGVNHLPNEGVFGGAVFLDGEAGTYLEAADHEDFEFAEGESWSVSLWYKREGEENDQGLVTKGYQDNSRATTGYWQAQTRAGTFALDSRCCEGGNPRVRLDSDSGISHGDNEWHHFVIARDSVAGEIRLYVDGEITSRNAADATSGNWAMGENEDPLVIGNHFDRYTVGYFDDIAVWKGYALTKEDVAVLGENGVVAFVGGGTTISDPSIVVRPILELPQVPAVRSTQEIEVRNGGATQPLTINEVTISGTHRDLFAIESLPDPVVPGREDVIRFTFDPAGGVGRFGAEFEIVSNDPDAEDQRLVVPVVLNVIDPQGPLAHWRLDETVDAAVLVDRSGNRRSAQISFGATLGNNGLLGDGGNAVAINSGSAVTASGSAFPTLESFSVSLWLQANEIGAETPVSVFAKGSDPTPNVALLLSEGGLSWLIEEVQDVHTEAGVIIAGEVYHIVVTHESASQTTTIYVNGEARASGVNSQPFGDTRGAIWLGSYDSVLPLDGVLDDVQIYDRVISASDVETLFAEPGSFLRSGTDVDSDDDGLTDAEEAELGTDALKSDTDDDGLTDKAERDTHQTDPTNPDTDADGFGDAEEIALGSDPTSAEADQDADGLTDAQEFEKGTHPGNADTDGDGISDSEESATDPLIADTDRDGLDDGREGALGTDATNRDSDDDGFSDGFEVRRGWDPLDGSDPGAGASGGPLAESLVAYFPLDEANGDTVSDQSNSPNTHTGQITGTAEWKPNEGRHGGAIFFDGSNGFIEVPDHDDFQFPEDESWTVSLWYKRDGEENDQGLVTKGYHDNSRAQSGYWQLQTRADGFTLDSRCCEGGTPRSRIDSNSGISHGDNEWHHFLVTRDAEAQEIRLYVDGHVTVHDIAATDVGGWAMGENDDPLVIANHFDRFTQGWFDDVAIWKGYAVDEAEVEAIAVGIGNLVGGGGTSNPLPTIAFIESGPNGLTISSSIATTIDVQYSETLTSDSWVTIGQTTNGIFEDSDAVRTAAAQGYYRLVAP